jgi:AraC-like DNA-binding protein
MINYVGFGDRTLDVDPVPYQRDYCELLVLLQGQCGLRKTGQPLHMSHQSAWLMPSGSRHGWQGDGRPCRLLSVMLENLDGSWRESMQSDGGLHTFTSSAQRKIFAALGERLYAGRTDYWRLQHLFRIVHGEIGLLFASSQPELPPPDWRVTQALAWFDEHMHLAPRSEDIAQSVGCSSAHLRRLFQAAGQAPLGDRLEERRLARATGMLTAGHWTTGYIARQCGWGSASALTHAMRRRYGCTVREWLRRQ